MAPTTEPVIIGVADTVNRTSKAIEPLDLISNAIAAALADTGLSKAALTKLKEQVDDLTIIRSWTWPYDSLPDLVADRVGIANAGGRRESEHGGNQPVKCLDEACRTIMKGERRVAVLGGGEALGSCRFSTHVSFFTCSSASQVSRHRSRTLHDCARVRF